MAICLLFSQLVVNVSKVILYPHIYSLIVPRFSSNKVRNNKAIKGIHINQSEHKISQYADDTSVFLDGSEKSLNEMLKELEDFANISGLNINFSEGTTCMDWLKEI